MSRNLFSIASLLALLNYQVSADSITASCPESFELIGERCFAFHHEQVTLREAITSCATSHGALSSFMPAELSSADLAVKMPTSYWQRTFFGYFDDDIVYLLLLILL